MKQFAPTVRISPIITQRIVSESASVKAPPSRRTIAALLETGVIERDQLVRSVGWRTNPQTSEVECLTWACQWASCRKNPGENDPKQFGAGYRFRVSATPNDIVSLFAVIQGTWATASTMSIVPPRLF